MIEGISSDNRLTGAGYKMGCTCSRKSEGRPASHPTARINIPLAPMAAHAFEGHSDVSRPRPTRERIALSRLIDPEDLAEDSIVRSPSGGLLTRQEYFQRGDRPLSLRERQQRISERSRTRSRLPVVTEQVEAEGDGSSNANRVTVRAVRRSTGEWQEQV